jgi:PKD repeat protein/uncharacterized protein YraI
MDQKGLFNRLAQSSLSIKIATLAVAVVWGLVLVTLIAFTILLLEKPTQTLPPPPGETTPTIALEPATGQPGTTVGVRGEGWNPGDMVLVFLMAPGETEPPSYAVAGLNADALGRFATGFVVPAGPEWENQGLATILAQAAEGGAAAQTYFSVLSVQAQPTSTPLTPTEATGTPTEEISATSTATPLPEIPMAAPAPETPTATAITDLNVRSGPGIVYTVLGVLRTGQSAEITGISANSGWWQIQYSGAADGRGWVSAPYVTAKSTGNLPVVQAPPLPATSTPIPAPTPTPTATPVLITDWRGEYYSNPNLSGAPVLVRNDVAINFDWGSGSPESGLPADNFSVRWSRGMSFSAGTYRFYARVDDGVRLWVDGTLIVDRWHDSAPTMYSADRYLSGGWHNLHMEYYERGGGASAQLAWERLDQDHFPDWKAEYFDNRKLKGKPILSRNETETDHNWRHDSPGPGVPEDDFSARWTRKVKFKSGTYLFRVRVDDGIRVWVDDERVIDSWKDGSVRWIEAEHKLSGGKHRVKVEYYEHGGDARIEVSWEREQEPTNQSPQAVPGGPYTVNEGSQVTLNGSGSKDADGSIVKHEWDLNYDGKTFVTDTLGNTAGTSYPDGPATVTVALRVTDDKGARHIATAQVKVDNVAPSAEAGGPYVGRVGALISMTGTGTDPGTVDQAGLTYAWDFGDGTQGAGPIVAHSYAQPGEYTLTLTVSDKDGAQGTDTATMHVTVHDQPPTAAISGPTNALVGETLSFDGSGSSDDGSIVSYTWDFGDGATASGVNVSHSYGEAGSYNIILAVTDAGGLSDTSTYTVLIEESVTDQPPVAVINGPGSALVGETTIFDSGGSHDPDGTIVSYVWTLAIAVRRRWRSWRSRAIVRWRTVTAPPAAIK